MSDQNENSPYSPEESRETHEESNASSQESSVSANINEKYWQRFLAPCLWLGQSLINAALVLLVCLGILWSFGYALRSGWIPKTKNSDSGNTQSSPSQRYICPMMCVPPTTEPGRCPVCGMELVEATSGGDGDGVSISIEPAHRRLIGIQTAMAKLDTVNRTIKTIGSIQYDESRLSTISAYVDGRLEQLYADYVGVPVSQGDDLALIYSPELYTAQAEYLAAQESKTESRFVDKARIRELAAERLFELGMSEPQIETLKQEQKARSRIRVKSPQNGTVIEKLAVEGDYVKTGQGIYRIADLSTVWMMLDLFPDDASRVLFGQEVEAEISSAPGIVFTGRVAFIDPTVNSKTRSVRVRVEMLNLDGKLRPGDFATARVTVPAIPRDEVYDPALAGKYISPMHPQVVRDTAGQCPICDMDLIPTSRLGFASEPLPEQKAVTIPRDAILMAGNSSVVYVETEPGRFEVRRIALGALTEKEAVVAEGLNAGEMVATKGNFLLDSQSQLAGNPSLLDPSDAPRFAPGPLPNPSKVAPLILNGEAAEAFDKAYRSYFEIQASLAADSTASPVSVNTLIDGLVQVLGDGAVPATVQAELLTARNASERLVGSLERSRLAFRTLSHSMIKAIYQVRGLETSAHVLHYYCPMVPGGGGDWLQAGDDLKNPYWGSEMLTCGELVRDLSLQQDSEAFAPDDDPFEGLEVQSLDLGN